MKRTILTALCAVCALMVLAQKNYTRDEIEAGWTRKTITGVKDGNILTLLTAFNKVWRTTPATELLAHPVSNENHEDAYAIVVDRPNGYVSAAELGDDGEDIEACVWKRSNGHKLFAVVYTRYHGLFPHPLALFYDYDAAKQTLTPEPNALTQFAPAFRDASVDIVRFQLPQKGKDVQVTEYLMGWYFSITHTYKWDGMEPKWTSTTIDNYDKMCQLFDSRYQLENKVKFNKFALVDLDEDDNPELWLLSENDENQAIFSIREEEIQMVASSYYKTHLLFHENSVVGSAGGCGTGCFRAEYTKLDHSKPVYQFVDQQDYDYEKDEMVSTYYKDDKEVSEAEGERIMDSFGEVLDVTPLMLLLRP